MEIKAIIQTAHGSSTTLEKWLKNPFIKRMMGLSGKGVYNFELFTNNKNKIIMEIECNAKKYLRITKNLSKFGFLLEKVMNKVIKSKMVRRQYNISDEDVITLKALVKEQPDIEIIKAATAEELNEAGESFWTTLKKKFRKVKNE